MADKHLNPEDREIFIQVLSEIGSDALLIATLCGQACANNGDSDLDRSAEIIAQKIGWLADFALNRMGNPGCVGGAEDWMFSHGMKALVNASPSA